MGGFNAEGLVRLLGPVEIAGEQGWVRAGPAKQSCVLAALALHAGEAVGVHGLIDQVWGFAQPETANGTLYSYVARLRGTLRHDSRARLERAGAEGYRLEVEPGLVDVHRMRSLAARAKAREAAGDDSSVVELWRTAAALWRGGCLTGVEGEWAQRVRRELTQECLAVAEARFSAELRADPGAEVLGELEALFTTYPRESLAHSLMLALEAQGRRDEALAAFELLAQRHAESDQALSPELRALRDRIAAQTAPPPETVTPRPAPAQLPAATATFIGRAEHVTALRSGRDVSNVLTVDGMAGIGKTTLAVHTARALAEEYPDGQLFIDLHGSTDGASPVDPTEALARMLVTLGVPAAEVPAHLEDRAAMYRSALAGRRVIVVLDNARDERQVAPLLPGGTESLVLITSRRRLVELDDVSAVSLAALSAGDAARLFASLAGIAADDTRQWPTVEAIVERCGRLPLAIRIAAARLRSRRHWTAETLLRKLSASPQPLTELELGQRSVLAAFAVSYEELDTAHRRLFRLLGLPRIADFDVYAAAALADVSVSAVEDMLDALTDAHLLMPSIPGRYRFHDLIGHFAAETAGEEPPDSARAALRRLLDVYTVTAGAAARLVDPHLAPAVPETVSRNGSGPTVDSRDAALAWCDNERPNLVTAVGHAVALESPDHAVSITTSLGYLTQYRGCFLDQIKVCESTLRLIGEDGDPAARARLLSHYAMALRRLNRGDEAFAAYHQARDLAEQSEDPEVLATVFNGLGNLHAVLGDYVESVKLLHRTISLTQHSGDDALQATAHLNCAPRHVDMREYEQATAHLDQAQRLFETLGHDEERIRVDHHRARLLRAQGQLRESLALQEKAAQFCRDTRTNGLGYVMRELAVTRRELGDTTGARQALREARDFAENGFTTLLPSIHIELGHVDRIEGDLAAAITHYTRAGELSRANSHTHETGVSHKALAETYVRLRRFDEARSHYEEAAAAFEAAGLPAAEDMRTRLRELNLGPENPSS